MIELQVAFAPFRGEWRVGDRWYNPDTEHWGFISIEWAFNPLRKAPIRKLYWLPLPIDPVNPERGLWGMVDWDRARIATDDLGTPDQVLLWTWPPEKEWQSMSTTEALLRAIKAQKEGK